MAWLDGNHQLIKQLLAEIERRLNPEQAPSVGEFARQYYETFPMDELRGRQLGDVYASTYGSWHYLQYYDSARPKVRVFNPEFERHGWQLGHTVVAILCRRMAFALDSVRGELNRRNITIYTIHSVELRLKRDAEHRLVELLPRGAARNGDSSEEILLYLEINRHTNADEIAELEDTLREILGEVAVVEGDFPAMMERAREARVEVGQAPACDGERCLEVQAFVDWMLAGYFTFLGYEYLQVEYRDEQPIVTRVRDRDLGLLKRRSSFGLVDLHQDIMQWTGADPVQRLLSFSKSSVRSRVHRRVYPDYIGIRVLDDAGRIVAEHRFLGMYTSRAYTMPPSQIPVVRHKIAEVMARAGFNEADADSHSYSELARVLEVHPRDELFHASVDELFDIAIGITQIQERRQTRLFVRRDSHGKFVSCLVYMPRDLYRTELRRRIQNLLCDAFAAEEAEFTTFFSESVLTRTHFVLRIDPAHPREVDASALQADIVEASLSWQDHLRNHLVEEFGEEQGLVIAREYEEAFPAGYRDDYEPRAAVADIRKIASLRSDHDIAMSLHRMLGDDEQVLRFRLFHRHAPLPLSDVMPILENLGLRAIGERPYDIQCRDGHYVWIHEFVVSYGLAESVDISEVGAVFQEAFARIWFGQAESDAFNKLVLGTRLGWRPCAMLRAYARYLKQIQLPFSSEYIADTLSRHLRITETLVELFHARFDPAQEEAGRIAREQRLQTRIVAALDEVENLGEDRIIRHYMALIRATVRTNYFQRDAAGGLKNYFSFKLLPRELPEAPLPRPLYEVFVYSARVEGVHLRTSKVARGGLRWSDRLEDYRTEVLGLLKAQQVKNAVIVPSGAKGGFVAKRLPHAAGREAVQDEGIACYRIFVQGLLDITDNRVEGGVRPPAGVVCKDDDDAYLVVAADKGTASFSDIANEISRQYGFWLGDAFASGGSVGYDHKKMGITARGAWVSVERHCRELGLRLEQDGISVIGIGDMSGDVFGNGMLRSPRIRLLAAFNHQHIFIDPEPDPAAGYRERERLFRLPRSSWEDYDPALISAGGGVFRRSAKSIPISAPMRERFAIEAELLTPAELISALLRAPVDLIWNGGIGTYVKASGQSHADCGDKANDPLRVDARDLRARIIAEGGNLGVTQLGRVEFALAGGRCNTDFIDNAGGVDCSDHEVNIKIALNVLVAAGDMTEKQRRELLESMTDAVAELVINNNYRQTQALSLAEREALARTGEYRRLIQRMEQDRRLSRALEFIPDDDTLVERKTAGKALTRPELAVLISYTKSQLKTELVNTDAPDDPHLAHALDSAFPAVLRERYGAAIDKHRLRREIIATQLANDMVNLMGITFVDRITFSTGATIGEVVRSYVTARDVFDMHHYWQQIEALDGSIEADLQLEMMAALMRLVRRGARWFIRNRRVGLEPARELERFRAPLAELYRSLPGMVEGNLAEDYEQRRLRLAEAGVPPSLAAYVAAANLLYSCLGIIDAADGLGAPPARVAEVYMALAQQLELDWFAKQIADLKIENQWQALAREAYRDDLEWQMRALAAGALRHFCGDGDVDACIRSWIAQQEPLVGRWRAMLTELHGTDAKEFAMYSVAIRELLDLAQSSRIETAA